MKTIKEWLESIEDETIRTQALENMTNEDEPVRSISRAITLGFVWIDTKQGYSYWEEIAESFLALEQSTNP